MAVLLTLALAVIGKLLADEIKLWLPQISHRLLDLAVKCLPREERERRHEEWAADLQSFPEGVVKCLRALDLSRAGISIDCSYRSRKMVTAARLRLVRWYLTFWLRVMAKTASRLQSRLVVFRTERGLAEGADLSREQENAFETEFARIEMLILATSARALGGVSSRLLKKPLG